MQVPIPKNKWRQTEANHLPFFYLRKHKTTNHHTHNELRFKNIRPVLREDRAQIIPAASTILHLRHFLWENGTDELKLVRSPSTWRIIIINPFEIEDLWIFLEESSRIKIIALKLVWKVETCVIAYYENIASILQYIVSYCVETLWALIKH